MSEKQKSGLEKLVAQSQYGDLVGYLAFGFPGLS